MRLSADHGGSLKARALSSVTGPLQSQPGDKYAYGNQGMNISARKEQTGKTKVKGIIDVQGLPTSAKSPLCGHQAATTDAPVVATLRRAGAVILGKTVTVEYACPACGSASAAAVKPFLGRQ